MNSITHVTFVPIPRNGAPLLCSVKTTLNRWPWIGSCPNVADRLLSDESFQMLEEKMNYNGDRAFCSEHAASIAILKGLK